MIAESLRHQAVPIEQVSADPANARRHNERGQAAVIASLRRFRQRKPILVDANGVTIAGAGVLAAARELGWTHIAVTRHEDLAGADRAAYAIADNRTGDLSEFDDDVLASQLAGMNPDELAAAGFTAKELADLTADPSEPTDQDEIPEPAATAVSRRGDLWIMGEQRLLCGDCTDHADVKRVMQGELATLVATDPPYLVGYDGTNHMMRKGRKGNGAKDWSGSYGVTWDDFDANSDLYPKFLAAAAACAAHEDAAWYCWHASSRFPLLEAAWRGAGLLPHCQIIWVKNRGVPSRTWFAWQHEPCLVGFKAGHTPAELEGRPMLFGFEPCLMGWKQGNKPKRIEGQPILSTVWPIDAIPNTEDRPDHPTPKPLECFAIPMRQHTERGAVVYEPFSGSGTAVVVAEQLHRRCRAIEISGVYVDVCIRRWQKLSGKPAVLDGDGRSWAEIAAARAIDPPISPHTPDQPAPAETRPPGKPPRTSRRRPASPAVV